ncbi:MAG: hypothetical protein IPM58_13880 [Nitrospira sp.]|nr:hypothetical protein [Nitrospira sp.]
MQLVAIYGWDIDFALDIRSGDRFSIIYEEHFKNGRKVREGPITAAEFINREHPIVPYDSPMKMVTRILFRYRPQHAQGLSAHTREVHPYQLQIQREA